jgi:hypothetical protein
MSGTYTGGCACGAVRYEARGAPVAQLHSQCTQCRRRSGSGLASFLAFMGAGAVTVAGTPASYSETGDSGAEKRQNFCASCGTPVFTTFPARPDLVALYASSLDAPEHFKPSFVTYAARGLDWDPLAEGLTRFEMMPA